MNATILRLVTASSLLAAVLTLSHCDKTTPSAQELVKRRLVGSVWQVKSVAVDGVDVTNNFAGMTIQFTETQFTSVNGGQLWPSSGSWQFRSLDGKVISRNDNLELNLNVTDASLEIRLYWAVTTFGSGRPEGIKGNYTFVFAK